MYIYIYICVCVCVYIGGQQGAGGAFNNINMPKLPWPLSLIPTQLWVLLFLYLFMTIASAMVAVLVSKFYFFMPIFMFAPSNLKWRLIGLLFIISMLQYYQWIPEFDSFF